MSQGICFQVSEAGQLVCDVELHPRHKMKNVFDAVAVTLNCSVNDFQLLLTGESDVAVEKSWAANRFGGDEVQLEVCRKAGKGKDSGKSKDGGKSKEGHKGKQEASGLEGRQEQGGKGKDGGKSSGTRAAPY